MTVNEFSNADVMPGHDLDPRKAPAHWLLARMGKRVLRPGGRELTRQMLDSVPIGPNDAVVEFAPGLGATARLVLERNPATYTAIERDNVAAKRLGRLLRGPGREIHPGTAENSELPDSFATVVYGEAMLTMQPSSTKAKIIREAFRLLKPGGHYAIHELCLAPDDLEENKRNEILQALVETLHVGARPLLRSEWRTELEKAGFSIDAEFTAPLRLLEPIRLVKDEGLGGALRFATNVLRDPVARERVPAIRGVFRAYQAHLKAVAFVATKPMHDSKHAIDPSD